ncbi:globin family protein [uncultured Roseobacter sp.]|uniref:globin family protein n=1 Tax=uncultured Roseobacter sp. TaxID=114847 RepID=UPI002621EFF1|nr:globin family protein [uncultured Roseobacter sp.]
MQREQIILVQDTWQHVLPIAEVAADLFYERLFEIDPSVKALFENADLSAQKGKLLQMLAATIADLHAPATLFRDLEELGHRHATYGVQPEHYDLVGKALLWTLEKGLADIWSIEVREAWAAAYGLIAQKMLKGAARAEMGDDYVQAYRNGLR